MQLWPAFILGLVGSLHCAGMCGPLILALPGIGNSGSSFLLGRITYNLGRILTYSFLGALSGTIGHTLALAGFQRWLSFGAGIAILVGMAASYRYPLATPMTKASGWLKAGLSTVLRKRSYTSVLLLGLLNGLLPCGLVYVACAGAVAAGGFGASVAYMLAFGLGTVPMMLGIGFAGKKVQFVLRLKFQKLIPACVVLLGVLLILRGMPLGIPFLSPTENGHCPACYSGKLR